MSERSDLTRVGVSGMIGPCRLKGYHLHAMLQEYEQRGNKDAARTSTIVSARIAYLTVSYRMIISNMVSDLATSITDASAPKRLDTMTYTGQGEVTSCQIDISIETHEVL